MSIKAWFGERTGAGAGGGLEGGPSFAYVLGAVLVMLLVLEVVTGAALAAFYSPSTAAAWGSVAYVQDQLPLGWLVRGLHVDGASALVIITGLHLVIGALRGAHRAPREVVWWLGILLLLLVLGFAITGYVLRWDQAGYWANRVEIGIAAGTPVVGDQIRRLALGGNDWGNLTLTRFYALHIVVLPALVAAVVIAHAKIARRLRASTDGASPRWPAQTVRDAIACALVLAILIGWTVAHHGADLAAPADPSSAYDARPLWYFRWLFELRHLAGSGEEIAALVAPAVVVGFLVLLPRLDRGTGRTWSSGVALVCAVIAGLTFMSVATDMNDPALAKRQAAADQLATHARALAVEHGVPATGALDVYKTPTMWRARSLFEQRCKGCHDAQSKDRKGPIIGPGHANRAWFAAFLRDPSSDAYWGRTKLAKTDDAMKPVKLTPDQEANLVEMLYAQTGATDVDPIKVDRGKKMFGDACTDCHEIGEGVAGSSAPGLGGVASRDWFTSFIGNPKSEVHMGDKAEMPRFDKDLSIVDRDALAAYLVWLRTATPADVAALEPL